MPTAGSFTVPGILLPADVTASRPVAADVANGTLFPSTDDLIIYQSDGVSAWTAWATITGTPVNPATLPDISDPGSPPGAGDSFLYSKSGRIYSMDSSGTVFGPFDAAGGGGGCAPDSGLSGAIEAFCPVIYFKCDEGSGTTYLFDFLNRFRMAKSGSPLAGEAAIRVGSSGSTYVSSGNAWAMGPTDGMSDFTIGMVWKENASGTDQGYWGAWDGGGMMFGYNGGMNIYGSGSLTGQSASGTHLWIATSISGTLTLYKDGSSVTSGSQSYTRLVNQTWGINWYSSGARAADGWASDCFYIAQGLDSTEVAGIAAEFTAI